MKTIQQLLIDALAPYTTLVVFVRRGVCVHALVRRRPGDDRVLVARIGHDYWLRVYGDHVSMSPYAAVTDDEKKLFVFGGASASINLDGYN